MSDYELHIHNLKDNSEHCIPFDDFIELNGRLRAHPEWRYGHLYRIDILADIDGKLQDISDCLVLQIDPEQTLKVVLQ